MKKEFSNAWIGSRQPRKQRKYIANAPLHIRKKFVSVNLAKDLRKKYGKRNLPLRKGDKVKIMRGKYKKQTGKVNQVNLKTSKIIIEGMQIKKQDGSKVNAKFEPSNLQIIELNLGDNKRIQVKTEKKMEESKK